MDDHVGLMTVAAVVIMTVMVAGLIQIAYRDIRDWFRYRKEHRP